MKRLVFKRSILNVSVMIWLSLGLIFYIEHGSSLISDSGNGLKTGFLWVTVGVVALVIDILLQYFIANRVFLNIIEGAIVCILIILITQLLIQ